MSPFGDRGVFFCKDLRGEEMNSNSENPGVGRAFQELVCKSLSKYFGIPFELEVKLPIGSPAKDHKFDCVSEDNKIVVECKCYTWTETGNVPSAKVRGLNEAVFYMSYLPFDVTKIICMKKATRVKKLETLAEYYCRTCGHLLSGITVFEIDDFGEIRVIRQ